MSKNNLIIEGNNIIVSDNLISLFHDILDKKDSNPYCMNKLLGKNEPHTILRNILESFVRSKDNSYALSCKKEQFFKGCPETYKAAHFATDKTYENLTFSSMSQPNPIKLSNLAENLMQIGDSILPKNSLIAVVADDIVSYIEPIFTLGINNPFEITDSYKVDIIGESVISGEL